MILLYLSLTIPKLLELIKAFGNISGYAINNTKSSIILLDENERENPPREFCQLKVVYQLTYLGIKIVSNLDMIVKVNKEPLMEEIVESTNRRISLPPSLIGRINILKMNTLPKLLYIFQNIPLPLPDDFFQKLRK